MNRTIPNAGLAALTCLLALALPAAWPADALAGAVAPTPLPVPLPAPAAAPRALAFEDAAPLATSIQEVVVYGGSARVLRGGSVPAAGLYLVQGLPGLADPDSVRVRLSQGSVASVEVLDRHETAVPSARIQQLRERLSALTREQRTLTDQRGVLVVTREHLARLLAQEAAVHEQELAQGRPNVEAWSANLAFVTGELGRTDEALRQSDWALEELATRIANARAELGQAEGGDVHLRDVLVDVLAPAGATLELEYLVARAGWEPQYDLRTSADATSVELVYRAKVWQQTGEDWGDVALLLSTAQPQRGAQGPDPRPLKVDILRPMPVHTTGRGRTANETPSDKAAMPERLQALGYLGDGSDDMNYETAVESHGLSVQFRLPRKETIVSRDRPSTVLIGQQALEVRSEHVVVPALDTTVWLRGHTKNTTSWVMLPGPASVYFGSDFIGQSRFGVPVQPDQEFVLHLGADPGLTVERHQVEDLSEEPGFLSKRRTQTLGWRIAIANNGGHPAGADGSVAVTVREAIPVPADDRIEVEVLGETVKPTTLERYETDRKERGIRTWILRVPKGGKAEIGFRVRTVWPQDETLVTR
jgi:uncharacterized protein (TIGR02231 family)